ncbi:MAG: WG repeat-containing protein [Fibrobacter sp.]|nr:WG repeat-containing protein [Fibrobacter sp.]
MRNVKYYLLILFILQITCIKPNIGKILNVNSNSLKQSQFSKFEGTWYLTVTPENVGACNFVNNRLILGALDSNANLSVVNATISWGVKDSVIELYLNRDIIAFEYKPINQNEFQWKKVDDSVVMKFTKKEPSNATDQSRKVFAQLEDLYIQHKTKITKDAAFFDSSELVLIKPKFDNAFTNGYDSADNPYIVVTIGGTSDRWKTKFTGGKWGVITIDGKEIVPCNYDAVKIVGFNNDAKPRITVKMDNHWYLYNIDKNCPKGIGFYNIHDFFNYDVAGAFIEDSAKSENDSVVGKWCVLDTNGTMVTQPKYDLLYPFNHNHAVFSRDSLWGVVTKDGKELFLQKYNFLEFAGPNHLYAYSNDSLDKEKIQLIDITNNPLIPGKFNRINKRDSFFFTENDEIYSVYNKNGKLICQPGSSEYRIDKCDSIILISTALTHDRVKLFTMDGKAFMNAIAFPKNFYLSHERLRFLKERSNTKSDTGAVLYGVVDLKGTIIVKPEYTKIEQSPDAFIVCKDNTKNSFVFDNNGKLIMKTKRNIKDVISSQCFVAYTDDDRIQLIDRSDNVVIDSIAHVSSSQYSSFDKKRGENVVILTKQNNKKVVIDSLGKIRLQGFYSGINKTEYDRFVKISRIDSTQKNSNGNFVEYDGLFDVKLQKEIIPAVYDDVEVIDTVRQLVETSNVDDANGVKYAIRNFENTLLTTDALQSCSYLQNGYFKVIFDNKIGFLKFPIKEK